MTHQLLIVVFCSMSELSWMNMECKSIGSDVMEYESDSLVDTEPEDKNIAEPEFRDIFCCGFKWPDGYAVAE